MALLTQAAALVWPSLQHFKCPVCHKQHANIGQLVYHAKKVHELELDKVGVGQGASCVAGFCLCLVAAVSQPRLGSVVRCPTHWLATTAWP